MPSHKQADDWVLAMRDQLRISVVSAYRVSARRGKTKLNVRFQNETRQYATLDIALLPVKYEPVSLLFFSDSPAPTGGTKIDNSTADE